ncbi:matrixin family metalloprotease [bacterium]|nr:matrixin family metalloprotease [bacterium]
MKSALRIVLVFLCLVSISFAREDYSSYLKDIKLPAVWMKPKAISVYIPQEEGKKYLFERGFKAWDDALGSNLNFKYTNKIEDADISISFIEKASGSAIGQTYPRYMKIQGRVYLGKARIVISRRLPSNAIMSDSELYRTILHEIGHAIGILGHSENIYDIMYYSTAGLKNSSLSSRDIDTVKKMYGF